MKKITMAAITLAAVLSFSSCCTVNYNASLANDGAIGKKVGEANSGIILGLWSTKGEGATIKQAAENGGIKNVKQVEYTDKAVLGGLYIKHTTRVYGE